MDKRTTAFELGVLALAAHVRQHHNTSRKAKALAWGLMHDLGATGAGSQAAPTLEVAIDALAREHARRSCEEPPKA